jgi:hypothetical protein
MPVREKSMKMSTVAVLVAAFLFSPAGPAAAKWVTVGRNKLGIWAVNDKPLAKKGRCFITEAGVVFSKPKRTKWGMAVARKYKLRLCCDAWTFEMMAYQIVGKNKRIIREVHVQPQVKKIPPGSFLDKMIKVHCGPGPGGQGADSSIKKKTDRINAGYYVDHKRSCRYCKKTGPAILSCVCPDRQGRNHQTSINVQNCAMPISNCNGRLTCGPCPRP